MATYGGTVRRGLPRRPGGDAWPLADFEVPESLAVPEPAEGPPAARPAVPEPAEGSPAARPAVPEPAEGSPAVAPDSAGGATSLQGRQKTVAPKQETVAATGAAGTGARVVRRGLPRVPGGEPWPPAEFVAAGAPGAVAAAETATSASGGPASAPESAEGATFLQGRQKTVAPLQESVAATDPATEGASVTVRRGLPRVAGGESWPAADFAAAVARTAPAPASAVQPEEIVVETTSPDGETSADVVVPVAASAALDVSTPLPFTRTVWQGEAGRVFEEERRAGVRIATPEPQRIGPFTRLQWAGIVVVGGAGLLVAAAMAVLAVRWLLSLEPLQDWLVTYPGEYHLPEGAPVGFPAWLGWQHFFNVFLMVLIIRSGLQVRTEKRPTAFWAPRNNPKGKISLNLWLHQSLDILWIVNGVIFVVLLFITGQWMRIVPTSWEVFPNAVSAALQYVSLDWPTENGWVNYNSLQQLAYFATVFLAAPLAIVTGVRMSGIWPKNAKTLNRIYPVEWARAVHFPTMLYFVAFIAVHVFLVFATGALRNLNHMYAAQGSADPNAYAANWAGFWWFFASLVVIAGAWVAARPLVLAPIAKLFGNVSGR